MKYLLSDFVKHDLPRYDPVGALFPFLDFAAEWIFSQDTDSPPAEYCVIHTEALFGPWAE